MCLSPLSSNAIYYELIWSKKGNKGLQIFRFISKPTCLIEKSHDVNKTFRNISKVKVFILIYLANEWNISIWVLN